MINDLPGESNRVRRLFREQFTFQISVDTYYVPQGLAVAEAALEAGVTILELGTPLLKYEGVRNVVPIFRQRFPKALLLADMKTMDGGEGEANAVYSGGGNVIDFLALAGEATARAVCAVRDTFRQADPAIPRLAFADVLMPMQRRGGRRSRRPSACLPPAWTASAFTCSTTLGGPTLPSFKAATCTTWRAQFSRAWATGRPCRWWAASALSRPSPWPAEGCAASSSAAILASQTPSRATACQATKSNDTSGISSTKSLPPVERGPL